MSKTFEEFPVYKNALELASEIEKLCFKTKSSQFYFLKDQIRRASSSIILNIAEGSLKWNKKDKINFYRIAQASTGECMAALDLFCVYNIVNKEYIDGLKRAFDKVIRDLQALINSILKRAK